jgi:hypothetical protein
MADYLLVVPAQGVVVLVYLGAEGIQRCAATRHGPLHEIEIIGSEDDRRYESLQVARALRLPVQLVLAALVVQGEGDLQRTIPVADRRLQPR